MLVVFTVVENWLLTRAAIDPLPLLRHNRRFGGQK